MKGSSQFNYMSISWIFTFLVAFIGLWFPKLGLMVIFIMFSLITISFFKGRFWCGNVCPHGSLFDVFFSSISKKKKTPNWLASNIFAYLFFIFFMFNFSRRMYNAFNYWGQLEFIDKLGYVFVMTYLVVFLLGLVLAIIYHHRSWCHICPMGTMQKVSYKLGKKLGVTHELDSRLTITSVNDCVKCGICANVCPMHINVYKEFDEKRKLSNINCIKCGNCVNKCPKKILNFK